MRPEAGGWRRPSSLARWLRFNAVGAAGIAVQAGVLVLLVRVAGLHYLIATGLAVEAAVLHNFFWHCRWTWADRPASGAAANLRNLARFHATTGLCSIAGNLLVMGLLVGAAGLDPLPANAIALALCSVANYLLADRLVFREP
jgi:putative flippase GtrA